MEIDPEEMLKKLRFRSPRIRRISGRWDYYIWTMQMKEGTQDADDIYNTMYLYNEYLLIGTEKGKIYVFDVSRNEMTGVIQADKWINNVFASHRVVFSSGHTRAIEAFTVRYPRKIFRLKPPATQDSFGPNGVMFRQIGERSHMLVNTGKTRLTIVNTRTRKVLRTFQVKPMSSKLPGGGIIVNFAVSYRESLVAVLLKDDCHIYFYDFKRNKLVSSLKTYDPDLLPNRMFLLNSLLKAYENKFVLVLQFGKNDLAFAEHDRHIVSYMSIFVTTFSESTHSYFIDFGCASKLIEDNQVYISFDILRAHETTLIVGSNQFDGFVAAIGSSRGVSVVYAVDLAAKAIQRIVYMVNEEDRDEISTIVLFNEGAFKVVREGEIEMSIRKEPVVQNDKHMAHFASSTYLETYKKTF